MYAVSSLTGVQVKACQVSSCVFVCLSLFWMGLKKVIMCNSFDTWGGFWVICLFKIKNNLASLEGLQACAACLKVKPEFLNLTWVQTLTRTLLFFLIQLHNPTDLELQGMTLCVARHSSEGWPSGGGSNMLIWKLTVQSFYSFFHIRDLMCHKYSTAN